MTRPSGPQEEPAPAARYASPYGGRTWCPFVLEHRPMQRLMLVNIDGDPRCPGIEPQLFDDPDHGTGAAVIVYRPDRTVDVYHQPGVRLDPAAYAIGAGLHRMVERPLDDFRFAIDEDGVDLEVHLVDADGVRIDVRVRERRRGAMSPVALLAPVGGDIDAPAYLPLFFLYGFTLVPRAGTEVAIAVGGRPRAPLRFPIPIGLHRYWFLRYGAEPVICVLNPAGDGLLAPIRAPATGRLTHGGATYEFVARDGHPEVARIGVAGGARTVTISFDPPFPDVAGLGEGAVVEGRFRVEASGSAGSLGGRWSVAVSNGTIRLAARPAGGWRTAERSLLFRFVFGRRAFRGWADTYRWTATVEPTPEGCRMASGWARVPSPETAATIGG